MCSMRKNEHGRWFKGVECSVLFLPMFVNWMCSVVRTNVIDTAVKCAKSLEKNDVFDPTGSMSTICTTSCVTSGIFSKEPFVTKRVLRGKRRSSLKERLKRGRIYPMRRSDPPLPRGKEYSAEIELHGTDNYKREKRGEGLGKEEGCAQVEKTREGEQGDDEAGGREVGRGGWDSCRVEEEGKCSLIKSVAPVEVGYLGLKKVGLQRHILVSRHIGEGCGRLVRFRVPKHLLLRQIGCSKAPRRARSRVMGDGVEDEGNWPFSKQRTGTSAADWDDVGRRGNGLGLHRWLVTAKHLATWWMLRKIDAAGLLMNSVVTGARGAMGIKFVLQKNDARDEGQVIFLECICNCSSGFGSAGVPLAISRNNTRRWSGGVVNSLIWKNQPAAVRDTERKPNGQDRSSHADRHEVRLKGFDLRDEQGRRKFGLYFFRILGARMMAEAGIDKWRIMDVGRWKTLSVLERYLKGAQYKKVTEVSRKVWGELSENPTKSSTTLEKGLKDVRELLCRVMEKSWSVGFTESRRMNDCWLQSEAVVHVPDVFGLDTSPGMWKTRSGCDFGWSAQKVSRVPIGTGVTKCRRCFEKEVQWA